MDDDCNTARALGVVFESVREMNRALDAWATLLATTRAELATIGSVLGIMNEIPTNSSKTRKQRGLTQTQLTQKRLSN